MVLHDARQLCNRIVLILLYASILCISGCTWVGAMAGPSKEMESPEKGKPHYAGLAGHSAAVMVWADRAAKVEWPSIQLDLASQIQNKLYANKSSELKGTTWPRQPSSVVRYQLDHPDVDASPVTEVAPRLGISRLIYVEVSSFSTRSDASFEMYRGSAIASVKVIEVEGTQTKVGYSESSIRATFPPKATAEGVFNSTDAIMYRGVIAALAKEIAGRFSSE